MKWNSIEAIPELLFVGKNATIIKAIAHKFIEYKMQKMKNKRPLTFPKTLWAKIVTKILVTKLITM